MSRHKIDRHELYERAVQSPRLQARFLRALHTAPRETPLTLGEDFSGSGALSRAWIELHPSPHTRAVCVDHDPEPLARLRALAPKSIAIHHADVLAVTDPVDILAILNFSICEWKSRADLVRYLKHARSRMRPGAILVCDLYGGADAFALGESEAELREDEPDEDEPEAQAKKSPRSLPSAPPASTASLAPTPTPTPLRYIWEQREADPLTGRVVNAMHFHFEDGRTLRNAFVYDWRLWSVPELRDALVESGFATTEVHDRLGDAVDSDGVLYTRPVESPDELDDNYVVYIVARA